MLDVTRYDRDRVHQVQRASPRCLSAVMVCFCRVSLRGAVLVVAVGVLVAGWAVTAWSAPVSSAAAAGGGAWLGARATPLECGLLAQLSSADESGESEPDPVKEPWEERVEQSERNSMTAVLVFLGIVCAILLCWWGWGKVYHRPRKL